MLMTARRAQALGEPAPASPHIASSHPQLDRRHSDLSFSIDTRGKPFYRVLIAKDRGLFHIGRQSERRDDNFYDSIREGLLPFDGTPCFYLVPRAVLRAMLPAPALYFTLVAYRDREATQPAFAHDPDKVHAEAPWVTVAGDYPVGSLASMFGTPVENLFRVGAASAFEAEEEPGEDFASEAPGVLGLDAQDEIADEDAERSGAMAYDDPSLYDDTPSCSAAADEEVGEDEAEAQAYSDALADDDLRAPLTESDGDSRAQGDDTGLSLGEGYDDGFDMPIDESVNAQSLSGGEYGYGAAYGADDEGAYRNDDESEDAYGQSLGRSLAAHAYDAMPEPLPDEESESAHGAAQSDEDDTDGIDIEGQSLAYDDEYGSDYDDDTAAASLAQAGATRVAFDIEACKAVLARIMPYESGNAGFARVVEDGEFKGQFGTAHPAYNRYHLGLTYGAFPFVQENGTLGQLLSLMRERDSAAFERYFGSDGAALLSVTNNDAGPRAWDSPNGLSPRLQPVGGTVLWQAPWPKRFADAAAHPPFQGAQNEMAARLYVQPMLPLAAKLGLDSEQALTVAIDRAVQMGPQAAAAWIVEAVSPIQSPAQRQQVLDRLRHADLRAFQQAKNLPANGVWDTVTHVELLAALRAMPQPPLPVPTREQMLDAMARRAEGSPWGERMRRLRAATAAQRLFQV